MEREFSGFNNIPQFKIQGKKSPKLVVIIFSNVLKKLHLSEKMEDHLSENLNYYISRRFLEGSGGHAPPHLVCAIIKFAVINHFLQFLFRAKKQGAPPSTRAVPCLEIRDL